MKKIKPQSCTHTGAASGIKRRSQLGRVLESLPAVLVVFLMGALFVGCEGSSTTPEAASKSEKVLADREVVVAIYRDGAIEDLDAASYNGPHFLYKMIYEGLVEDEGQGRLRPILATSWDISEDGRTYVFHLRKNVKFSDGTDFDAEAAVFNLKRWIGNDLYFALTSSQVESLEALDKYTLKIVYKEAAYPILTELTYPRPVRFLSPVSITDDGDQPGGRFTGPVGTGPWMLESYIKEEEFTLIPNPHYWGQKPKVGRIRFKVVPDGQARVLALKSGEVDIVGGDLIGKIPLESLVELKKDGKLQVFTKGTLCSHFLAFNNDANLFDDKSLRLAINYAIDKKVVAESLFDNIGLAADGLYQPDVPYANERNNFGYPGDKEKARAILEQAGYVDGDGDGIREKDGRKLEYSLLLSTGEFPEWKPLAEFIQSELAAVGIKVNLNILDKNGYFETTQKTRKFDLALMRTASDSWMPHSSLLELYAPLAGLNVAKVWTDPWLLAKVKDTLTTIDPVERQKKYDQLFGFASAEALVAPLYYPVTAFTVNTEKIKNFEIGVNNYAPVEWEKLEIEVEK